MIKLMEHRKLNKKITLTTLKSFVKRNKDNLYVKVDSCFDGMTDGVEYDRNAAFKKSEHQGSEHLRENTLGYDGFYLVGSSRDYFNIVEENGFIGIEAYNCCGTSILAVKK